MARINVLDQNTPISAIRNDDHRIHYMPVVTQYINRIHGYKYSIRFWKSFIQTYSDEKAWFVRDMLVSMKNIEINNLAELVKENVEKSHEEIISYIQQKVCISREEIKGVIYYTENKMPQNIKQNEFEIQGLASDVMEELFSL